MLKQWIFSKEGPTINEKTLIIRSQVLIIESQVLIIDLNAKRAYVIYIPINILFGMLFCDNI